MGLVLKPLGRAGGAGEDRPSGPCSSPRSNGYRETAKTVTAPWGSFLVRGHGFCHRANAKSVTRPRRGIGADFAHRFEGGFFGFRFRDDKSAFSFFNFSILFSFAPIFL
ncbi:MAG: hypothetical protein A2979_02160 [Deltaproteobacteria bacterium RIFCSPLOWO2_01_FULL_45_74]|nr:MAG: hypothetical protein A2712_05070 [Deltaproteobacteria bacterium RIFCSPHIGHO2_01_FULL_43_49]OGQ15947.1 MAG: hypothetical protein A3D22_07770 [Deltaproteobacteria bacterium RIFCSPHIGHO2_02_FULL_44_53]OGQ31001.1 MAG: hypothetical protein A2979_02160 [Deltaproteobacteria bacterium RIFCSPLOWO2_01_FULL_45_74]